MPVFYKSHNVIAISLFNAHPITKDYKILHKEVIFESDVPDFGRKQKSMLACFEGSRNFAEIHI